MVDLLFLMPFALSAAGPLCPELRYCLLDFCPLLMFMLMLLELHSCVFRERLASLEFACSGWGWEAAKQFSQNFWLGVSILFLMILTYNFLPTAAHGELIQVRSPPVNDRLRDFHYSWWLQMFSSLLKQHLSTYFVLNSTDFKPQMWIFNCS